MNVSTVILFFILGFLQQGKETWFVDIYLELGGIKGSTLIICSPLAISDCIWHWPLGHVRHVKAKDLEVDYQQGSVIWNEKPIYLHHVPPYPRPCIYVAWWRRFTSVAHHWPGVGRMLGCRILLHFHALANASWFSDVWQRDDALGARWGCSSFSGQHPMRGGQMASSSALMSISLKELPCIVNLESHLEDSWSRRHWFFSVA